MRLRHPGQFARGYESIVSRNGPNADMLMDFGSVRLGPGDAWEAARPEEKAILLVSGEVEFRWDDGVKRRERARRGSLLDDSPSTLHLPAGTGAAAIAGPGGADLLVMATANDRRFPARLLLPSDCRAEERGKGTMLETSTRIVRTVFDDSDAPESNLVLGEVVAAPGKWSSYPPHHHPQPEIYHYRFTPSGGFGLTAVGEDAYRLSENDTVLIREGEIHPQAAAPGYAMWYLWVIRHLEGNRYVSPTFDPGHAWVMDPAADIWRPPSERAFESK